MMFATTSGSRLASMSTEVTAKLRRPCTSAITLAVRPPAPTLSTRAEGSSAARLSVMKRRNPRHDMAAASSVVCFASIMFGPVKRDRRLCRGEGRILKFQEVHRRNADRPKDTNLKTYHIRPAYLHKE